MREDGKEIVLREASMRIGKKGWLAAAGLGLAVAALVAYKIAQNSRGNYHYQAAQQALQRRDFRQASLHLQKCLAVWPSDQSVRLLAARTARREEQNDEASRLLRLCEQAGGMDPQVRLERRLLLAQQGDLDEAK